MLSTNSSYTNRSGYYSNLPIMETTFTLSAEDIRFIIKRTIAAAALGPTTTEELEEGADEMMTRLQGLLQER